MIFGIGGAAVQDPESNRGLSAELLVWAKTKMAGYQAPKIIRFV